ncbi:MAG TPA: HAD hydrolase family protein [Sediminibacterium sp.]|nr:HAD hydrolase family protein [Sediminibacterium sp.]
MLEAFTHITCFVLDVDGVLTDGTLLVLPSGVMVRRMHIRDGYAMQLAIKQGYRVVVISGGDSPEVAERLHKLGVTEVWMQISDKKALLQKILSDTGLDPAAVLYMGDDIPDLAAMQLSGLPCCPADAATEIREIARYISPCQGGAGCVRDVIEKVLKLRGHWQDDGHIRSR